MNSRAGSPPACEPGALPDWKHGYTDEEIAEAEVLYRAQCKEMYDRGYGGDFGCGLSFAMSTYMPVMWRHFFKRDFNTT
jgi:hypothetical protein